jgi:hypothetical protein
MRWRFNNRAENAHQPSLFRVVEMADVSLVRGWRFAIHLLDIHVVGERRPLSSSFCPP